ncbi:MAG: hypothetical protein Q9166_000590 [cf. Caloplaca sp. 2 TL-2023]
MDGSGASQHNPSWEELLPHTFNNPSFRNQESSWDPFSSTNEDFVHLSNRPSNSFSSDAFDPCSNHNRTSQYRRRNFDSPQNPPVPNTLLSNLPSCDYSFNPSSLPELRDPRPDQPYQLPGIDHLTQDFSTTDFSNSEFPWDSQGDDSLFDGDIWPTSQNNSFDIDFNNSNLNYFVDLTADASSPPVMPAATRKRRASATAPDDSVLFQRTNKRPRANSNVKKESVDVEHLDLVDVDDDGGLSKVLEQQQAAAIKEQQGPQGDAPTKLSNVQCIICMEPMTDMTVTHCGHLFCHTCIMEALIAGENQGEPGRGTSKCPVCRKKVSRPKEKSRDKREVIPLEIKFSTRSSLVKGKARA